MQLKHMHKIQAFLGRLGKLDGNRTVKVLDQKEILPRELATTEYYPHDGRVVITIKSYTSRKDMKALVYHELTHAFDTDLARTNIEPGTPKYYSSPMENRAHFIEAMHREGVLKTATVNDLVHRYQNGSMYNNWVEYVEIKHRGIASTLSTGLKSIFGLT